MIGLFKVGLILVIAFFLSRAFFVTVVMGEFYANQAKSNRIKTEAIPAARGVIVDRKGKVIANNIEIDGEIKRFYPEGESVGGVVGYLSDGVGISGLEKQYEELLKGKPGERLLEENARGKETVQIDRQEAVIGDELRLNLDLALQNQVYRVLLQKINETKHSGSVVVAKANGEVLALVSLPSFDPNLFIAGGKRGMAGGIYTEAKAVVSDLERKPLFNRTVAGAFAPGSVYKLVPAISALVEGLIDEDDVIEDTGEIKVGEYRYGNWYFDQYGRREGLVDVEKALARSNDIFFYRLGEKLGADKLVLWSGKFGLGKKTGIDYPGEISGLLPTPLWVEKEKGERWFLGNTYHLAIGQGDLLTTPIQINRMTGAVVTGMWCKPWLKSGEKNCEDFEIPREDREVVIEGMRQACMEGGTAFPFFSLKGAVVCKTGTAQHGGEDTKPHSWISVVVPSNSKEMDEQAIVVTVMLEAAGEGSYEAGPVARQIIDYILEQKL